ncbi:glycogen debranching protein GlgX [Deinococcus roseus]|uniref:Glycogen operon protein GlgX homolog n=1 Tax=Deinococcus roseus TaxID=392414 RepID=A0ABQ2DCM7_9DEIO|nr:glycogen debranching protein GlgX [Deinococcus roseus]GGJ52073.1 glycogen operon protein GlgX homolog [Deinococcus roseus]
MSSEIPGLEPDAVNPAVTEAVPKKASKGKKAAETAPVAEAAPAKKKAAPRKKKVDAAPEPTPEPAQEAAPAAPAARERVQLEPAVPDYSNVDSRIDFYPTHEYLGYRIRAGKPLPFGATLVPNGVNFSVYSAHATACTLVIFDKGDPTPKVEIPFPHEFKIGNVFSMLVFDLDPETLEYGYRMDGPWDPAQGHRFDPSKILCDPYARVISGRDVWGQKPDWDNIYPHRSRLSFDDFDWEDDKQLETPSEDLIVYEMHVRGFTRHGSSGVKFPGTFVGIREKLPYLKKLGVNAIELMPIFEFDEFEHSHTDPETGEIDHLNYWGYSTLGFFAPKAGYAATGKRGMQVDELKALIKACHKMGIEVILDVVFNHTAEGNEQGPTLSLKGLDNQTYYMLTPEGYYFNFSGTGNTINCNHPVVRNMVLDCLRYWVSEYHIDGFRFDLAAILGRAQDGSPLANPPLLESLAHDPILARTKLIAEAWDAGGLYQVGSFPAYGRWGEWNGKFRDTIRKFLKGEAGEVGEMAMRIQGSPDLYSSRGPTASINFITAHDGFTLYDSVSYNEKHNLANGENNNDGANDNNSWNCGAEGETDDPWINALRQRQVKNALAMMLTSQGIPMILMGDEIGRTQHGNNNTYCHDNDLNWMDWGLVEKNKDLLQFVQHVAAFRHRHPVLRNRWHLSGRDYVGSGYPDISFHGERAWSPDWSSESRTLAFMLCGKHARGGTVQDDYIYVAMNMHWEDHAFELPYLAQGLQWHVFANTGAEVTSVEPGDEIWLKDQRTFWMGSRSVAILVGKAPR